MIRALFRRNGRPVVLLGLSHNNLDRLRADGLKGYIEIKAEDLGIAEDIIITAAENERVMLDAFADKIGPETRLHISEKLKS